MKVGGVPKREGKMEIRKRKFYRAVFMVVGWYDLILGFAFFFFFRGVYSLFSVKLPDNPAYVHLAAAFIFVQGLAYLFVYFNMERNVDLVRVGTIYKTAYIGVSFYHWAAGTLPHAMFVLFGFLDLVFLSLFLLYLREIAIAAKVKR